MKNVVLFLAIASAASLAQGTWSSGAPIPTSVTVPAVGVLQGRIYLVGGYNGSEDIADTQIYDPSTNTWSTGTALPIANGAASAAVVKGVLYVFGGTPDGKSVTNAVWAYSASTKTWTAKANMPTARSATAAVVENNIIYVIGGFVALDDHIAIVESYNPVTDIWTQEASMLGNKATPAAGRLGNVLKGFTIVAADGFTSSNDTGDNEGYNASTNVWSPLKSDPTPRNTAFVGAKGLRAYVVGGYPGGPPGTPAYSLNESFNISTNSWKTLAPMPQPAMLGGSMVYKGLLYCIGGWTADQGTVLNNVQIYHP